LESSPLPALKVGPGQYVRPRMRRYLSDFTSGTRDPLLWVLKAAGAFCVRSETIAGRLVGPKL
jgi:hypothetical protein